MYEPHGKAVAGASFLEQLQQQGFTRPSAANHDNNPRAECDVAHDFAERKLQWRRDLGSGTRAERVETRTSFVCKSAPLLRDPKVIGALHKKGGFSCVALCLLCEGQILHDAFSVAAIPHFRSHFPKNYAALDLSLRTAESP